MPGLSAAQTAPLPGPADPDLVPRRFEQPQQPRSQEDPVYQRQPPDRGIPPGAEAVRFRLGNVAIDGVTVYTAADFEALIRPLLNTEISLARVYELADAIGAKYANDGYILSFALVPPQRIADGRVRIQVLEGFVDKVVFEGAEHVSPRMQRMGAKIAASRPLKADDLERYLLLIDDVPGVTARGVLRPSATQGASDLAIVMERKPLDAVASFDNRGSRFVGPYQATLGLAFNGLLGYDEQTAVRAAAATQWNELRSTAISHDLPLDSEGTRAQLSFQKTYVEPQFTLQDLRIEGEQTAAGIGVSHPFIRSRAENLSLRGRFDARNVVIEQDRGTDTITEDRVRAFRAGGTYDFVDTFAVPAAVTLFTGELSQGVNVLGARPTGSANLSRPSGHSQFTKLAGEGQRVQGIGEGFSFLTAVSGQFSFANLLASEEFTFGGAQYGRGFDPGEISGDHGIAAKAELQWGRSGLDGPLRDYQLYLFYDLGTVWRNVPNPGDLARASASSAGIGVRVNLLGTLYGNLEWGKPITGSVRALGREDGKKGRVFFTLFAKY